MCYIPDVLLPYLLSILCLCLLRMAHEHARRGDVKELLGGCAATIDAKAKQWSREQKDACLQETESAFKFGGSLLGYLR